MATQNKAQFISDVLTLLKKRYKLETSTQKFSVLESVVYGICHEDATRQQADQALEKFKTGFFDWNEIRVSSIAELQGVLEDAKISDAEERATRLRRFLRQMFEKIYGFNLDALAKKPLKDSVKLLQEYEVLSSDFVLATVTRLALGGHAIGVDVPTRRALERLGIADPEVDAPTLRGTLERAVPKTRGVEFIDLFEELAHDTCVAGIPDCPRCELKKICPTALTRKNEPAATTKPPLVGKTTIPPAKPAPSQLPPSTTKPVVATGKPVLPAPSGSAKPAIKPPAPVAEPIPAIAPPKPISKNKKPDRSNPK